MPKQRNTSPILPLKDFERIFRVIHGVLLKEPGNPEKSCLYFGFIGAAILRMHYKLPAEPVVGMAAYCLNDRNDILVFADEENPENPLTSSNFHCWVQVNGWFIDFSSPLFSEMLAATGSTQKCGRKMLQKRLVEAARSPAELHAAGQFYCLPIQTQTREASEGFMAVPLTTDIERVCTEWFSRPPKKEVKMIQVRHPGNIAIPTFLSPLRINGVW